MRPRLWPTFVVITANIKSEVIDDYQCNNGWLFAPYRINAAWMNSNTETRKPFLKGKMAFGARNKTWHHGETLIIGHNDFFFFLCVDSEALRICMTPVCSQYLASKVKAQTLVQVQTFWTHTENQSGLFFLPMLSQIAILVHIQLSLTGMPSFSEIRPTPRENAEDGKLCLAENDDFVKLYQAFVHHRVRQWLQSSRV